MIKKKIFFSLPPYTEVELRSISRGVVEGVVSGVVVLLLLILLLMVALVALILSKRARREKTVQHLQSNYNMMLIL